ncbi:type III polyketide synthase [Spongisporangium articulatum]|uniref:Type III polyketide synthase n=1 Tax=Spongisporangium articulatum TaxID=3362603 RepID=A0ABW8AKI6_9ACTN
MTAAVLTGQGHAFPPARDQKTVWDGFFAARSPGNPVAETLFLHCGIETRHVVVDPMEEDVSDWGTGRRMERYAVEARSLGRDAVAAALADAGLSPGDVGLFAVVSCTGYLTPGLDILISDDLGMPASVQRLIVGHMGCYAAVPGLAAVSDYVRAHGRPAVMLCVELTSLHVQPAESAGDIEQLVAHALFADAATAVVVEPDAATGLELLDTAASTAPGSAPLMTWAVTDHGFRMGLSPKVPDVLSVHVGGAVGDLLKPHGLDASEVDRWAVHPGGPRIVDVVEDRLRLGTGRLDVSRDVLRDNGNCSSGTVMLVLDQVRRAGVAPGESLVAMAFGPGLTLTTALMRQR